MSEPIAITGVGSILPPVFAKLLTLPVNATVKDRAQLANSETPEITGFEVAEGAPAFGHEIADFKFEEHLPNFKTYVDRTSAFALAAAKLALQDAGMLDPATRPAGLDIGCAYGTTFGCLDSMGLFWKKIKGSNPKFAQPLVFTHGYANSPSSLVCIEFGLKGAAGTFSGSFLSGIESLQFALNQIRSGSAECMLVGASESLSLALHTHLFSQKLLRTDAMQDIGIVPGEGAVFLVLEKLSAANACGKKALATFDGKGVAISGASGSQPNLELSSKEKVVIHQLYAGSQAMVVDDVWWTQENWSNYGELFSISGLAGIAYTVRPGQKLNDGSTKSQKQTRITVGDPSGSEGNIYLLTNNTN